MIELCENQHDNPPNGSNNNKISDDKLKRELKSRHITMIAIGGIIGPGLLVGSGTALAYAGPAGALIAFAATG
ncbi:unnamed protein product, partial [Rotaria magnacalcarata]